jgi:dsRNA-specific ribonuclease
MSKNQLFKEGPQPILVPFNKKNVLIQPEDVSNILLKFNLKHNVKHLELFQEGLTHKSYTKQEYNLNSILKYKKDELDLFNRSYERLEFLGDTICKASISGYIFERYPNEDEGFMTRLKTKLENRQAFAKFGKLLGLDQYVLISHQLEQKMGRTSEKIMEDCFEAFMGALYLDAGFDICRKILIQFLENEIDFAEILYNDNNYKDQLLRFYHKNKWSYPVYSDMKAEGPLHCRIYTIGVKDNTGSIVGIGVDHSKRKAEQIASKKALIFFGVIVEDNKEIEEIKGFD